SPDWREDEASPGTLSPTYRLSPGRSEGNRGFRITRRCLSFLYDATVAVIKSDRVASTKQPGPGSEGYATMDWSERRNRFRALIAGPRCVHPGSVYDAISARIAEDLGFEVGIFSGSIGSMTVLGAPDLVVLTLSEFAGQAYRICRAGNLCL